MTLAGKTLAVLGASYLQRPLLRRARALDVRTLCFAWEKDAVCRDEADRFFPISIRETEQIAAICRAEKIDGITSIASDAAVPTMVSAANALGLSGNPLRSLRPTTDKGAMREALARAGVPGPRSRCVRDIESARLRLSVENRNPTTAEFRWSICDAAHDETTYRAPIPAVADTERNQAEAVRAITTFPESVSYAAAGNAIPGPHGFCVSTENGGNGDIWYGTVQPFAFSNANAWGISCSGSRMSKSHFGRRAPDG